MAETKSELKDEFVGTLLLLAKSDQFKVYCEILKKQIHARRIALGNLLVYDQRTMAEQNRLHGEISGLELAMLLPFKTEQRTKIDQELEEHYKQNGENNG